MASAAYSTPVPVSPMMRVRSLTVAIPVIQIEESTAHEGRGCVVLDGQLVMFMAGRIPEPGGKAVVVGQDGRLSVETVCRTDDRAYRPLGDATVQVEIPGPYPRGITSMRRTVALVGAVSAS